MPLVEVLPDTTVTRRDFMREDMDKIAKLVNENPVASSVLVFKAIVPTLRLCCLGPYVSNQTAVLDAGWEVFQENKNIADTVRAMFNTMTGGEAEMKLLKDSLMLRTAAVAAFKKAGGIK